MVARYQNDSHFVSYRRYNGQLRTVLALAAEGAQAKILKRQTRQKPQNRVDIVGVTGSIPVTPTIRTPWKTRLCGLSETNKTTERQGHLVVILVVKGEVDMPYPDRYVITGIVKDGEHKGEKVWLHWSDEGGGWWMWGPGVGAHRFEAAEGPRFEDAMRCATGQTWTKSTVGPWYYAADTDTVTVEATPAIVTVR